MGVQQGALSEDGACACEVAKWLLSGAASQKKPDYFLFWKSWTILT